MNSKVLKSVLLAAGCSAISLVMGADADVERSIQRTVDVYNIDRQKQENEAAEFVNKGNQLFIDGKYEDAASNYNKAVRIYEALKPNSPHFQDKQEKTKELISRAYYYLAQETVQRAEEEANASEFDKAIALCKKAIKIYPASAKEMNQRIEAYTKMKNAAVRRNVLSDEQVIKDLSKNKYDIAVLLKKAKLLYRDGRYDEARKYYQEVLLKDRFSAEAIQGLRASNLRLTQAGEDRFRLTHKKAIAETSWKSVTPIVNAKSQDVRANERLQDFGTVPVMADETAPLRAKLKKIVIPPVNFGDRLPVVLKWLRQRSIENDPDREGVNIFLYFPDPQTAGEGGAEGGARRPQAGLGAGNEGENEGGDDEGDEDEDEDAEAGADQGEDMSKYPVVNLNLANKTLLEVIEALAQAAKLKYKIEKNAVIFAPMDAPLDDMQIKVFLFDQNMVEQFGGSESPDDLKSNFVTNGVPFPTGAKVMYDAKFRALIALNTPENLELLNKTILEARKREPEPVVQIQVKFVEVEQNDLKELGFIQTLGRPNGASGNKTTGRLQFDRNDVTLYDSGRTLFSYSRSNDGYDYNLAINAVNQLDSKDVLSSPKVLTNPGKKVTIKMTSERYFQWDYEEGEYENNNSDGASGYTYTPPWPEFEMQELGITFETTPTVDKAKRLITMPIAPWVRSLVGWTAYTYYVSGDDGGGVREEIMKRPIISERTTDTIITLYDNETVVIGGIIKDYTILIDDKIPFLGDIPLLGKLFTSQSSQIKKTNLLIFVTARLLKPDGSPYYQYDSRGRPNSIGLGDIY